MRVVACTTPHSRVIAHALQFLPTTSGLGRYEVWARLAVGGNCLLIGKGRALQETASMEQALHEQQFSPHTSHRVLHSGRRHAPISFLRGTPSRCGPSRDRLKGELQALERALF